MNTNQHNVDDTENDSLYSIFHQRMVEAKAAINDKWLGQQGMK
ncbi:hypothetical protein [Shewanella surugensis]|nr:hypothetical protein [Shewanella surugensis]